MNNYVYEGSEEFPLLGETSLKTEVVGLPWLGGKKGKLRTYMKYFPEKIKILADPFMGGGSVAFSTPAEKVIANDIDFNMINLYQVLSENNCDRLVKYDKTRENYKYAHNIIRDRNVRLTEFERAKYIVADIFMSMNGARISYSEQCEFQKRARNCLSKIHEAIQRKNIEFRCGSAFDLITKMYKNTDVFWFVDPPYFNSAVKNHTYYAGGMLKDWEHEKLSQLLGKCEGKVMLCGYRHWKSNVYYDMWLSKAGFHCYKLMDTYAYASTKSMRKPLRKEFIWVNYEIEELKQEEVDISSDYAA